MTFVIRFLRLAVLLYVGYYLLMKCNLVYLLPSDFCCIHLPRRAITGDKLQQVKKPTNGYPRIS
jgi:hypothetical protein